MCPPVACGTGSLDSARSAPDDVTTRTGSSEPSPLAVAVQPMTPRPAAMIAIRAICDTNEIASLIPHNTLPDMFGSVRLLVTSMGYSTNRHRATQDMIELHSA